jgi:class 3 adenylate cyclase/tetratricopeptide (TPR) repeat protein
VLVSLVAAPALEPAAAAAYASQVLVCPKCGQENPAGARFCLACGTVLQPAAASEERKVVTVLFADLVGFTSRAEQMDPEDVRSLLAPYHQRLRGELERFGGTVEKFIGDAVVALFGAPIAHEDDPERAVRAALAIRDWVREEEEELQLRIAVNTGEALISLGARPEAGEGMASGDVVNTTARLQSAAPVNGILVGEATWRATRDRIDYAEHEPVSAKGKSAPIQVWEPVHARARPGMDLEQRSLTPLVGRERELSSLFDIFDRVRREREPQLITLVGVPGIGKSRLVAELFQRIDSAPEMVWWRQGRALPYGAGVSFWALSEMVKAQAGIHENDGEDEAGRKLGESVAQTVDEHERDWVQRQLDPLVGLGDDSPTERNEAFAAWRRYLEGLAEQHPLVLVFEDLHWADEGMLDFVDHLAEWASGVPILMLGTARPELLDRRPNWGGGKLNASTLALSALEDADAARVIGAVLEQALLPADLQETLLERAGGNPLYAEQFARLFVEHGSVENLPVPENVQGIIAARLDGLPPNEKRVLQDAAVLGKVFWLGGVGSLTGFPPGDLADLLHALGRKGFVRRERRSAVAGESEFAFRHVLVREVAYGQIPRPARADKHVAAAEWVASLGRAEDHAELLAYHYATAVDLARATGEPTAELAERAREALRRAGDRAAALNSHEVAAGFYRSALEFWPPDDPDRPALLFALGKAEFLGGNSGTEMLQQAADAALAARLPELAAEAEALSAEAAWYRGERDVLTKHLEHALELVDPLPDSRRKAWTLSQASRYAMLAGEHEAAIAYGRRALEMASTLDLPDVRIHALNNVGSARARQGDLTDGVADIEASAALAEELNSPELARSINNLASIEFARGNLRRCLELELRSISIAERFGLGSMLLFSRANVLGSYHRLGMWDRLASEADELLADSPPAGTEATARMMRAWVRVPRGDLSGARADSAWALELGRRADEPQAIMPSIVTHAYVLDAAGKKEEAAVLVDEALARLEGGLSGSLFPAWSEPIHLWMRYTGAERVGSVFASMTAETPWLRAGRLLAAGDLHGALAIYREMDSVVDIALLQRLIAADLVNSGRRAEADAHLDEALAIYRSVGATRDILLAEKLLAETA